MLEYRPISNIDLSKLSEEPDIYGGFHPSSYYDLSGFKEVQYIKCADELFDGTVPYEDIREIFLVMKGAGNTYDDKTFEVQTVYPANLLRFIQRYIEETRKQGKMSLDMISFLNNSFNSLKNISIQVKNQNITCDKLIKLVDKGVISDEESLLKCAK